MDSAKLFRFGKPLLIYWPKQGEFATQITRIYQLGLIYFAGWIGHFLPKIAAAFRGFTKLKTFLICFLQLARGGGGKVGELVMEFRITKLTGYRMT